MEKKKLLMSALTKFLAGLVFMGLFLFLPAGTLHYPNAWLFLALLFIPMLILGVVLFFKAPALLEKRLQSKEKESAQKGVVAVSGLMFIGSFVLAARIQNEEDVLEEGLAGYTEYKKKVNYRLIPFVW